MRTLFIGDLHLSADRPDITQAFEHFLNTLPQDTEALYILGDLFEVWVGDDVAEPFTLALADQLRRISQHTPIYYTHGNRDFMLGKAFARRAGMKILPEVFVTQLYGNSVVILHGDSLCTLDKQYQRFRKFRSINLFRWIYSKLPRNKRLEIAAGIRAKSKLDNKSKTTEIMDVEGLAVNNLLSNTGTSIMIHGHTHRPAIHQLDNSKQRLVVGDWYTQGSVLTITPEAVELSQIPFE